LGPNGFIINKYSFDFVALNSFGAQGILLKTFIRLESIKTNEFLGDVDPGNVFLSFVTNFSSK
jgi:hypothetical protein